MEDGHLDVGRLGPYLAARLPFARGALAVERVGGGQSNPTFILSYQGGACVLRKKPSGTVHPSAHAIDREFRVLSALSGSAVPVPRPFLYEADPGVVGTPFYVMERLHGRVMPEAALPGLDPDERRALYRSVADTLAALHAVDPEAVGLAGFGRPGNYFARQLSRWSGQWQAAPSSGVPELAEVIAWLSANMPEEDGPGRIVHGDFRFGNLMVHPTEPRVVGVLDWELATLGDPLADLGFACMPWHTAPDEYGGILGLDHDALGLPAEAAFVARYEGLAAPSGRLRPFHVVFALFRFAVIFVGIAERARAGTAASADAAHTGRLAANFARRALALARRS